MPFFFAFPSSFDLYPFSFSPPVSTSTIRLSDLTHDIVELSLPLPVGFVLRAGIRIAEYNATGKELSRRI
jgi:hypothetical protein